MTATNSTDRSRLTANAKSEFLQLFANAVEVSARDRWRDKVAGFDREVADYQLQAGT